MNNDNNIIEDENSDQVIIVSNSKEATQYNKFVKPKYGLDVDGDVVRINKEEK